MPNPSMLATLLCSTFFWMGAAMAKFKPHKGLRKRVRVTAKGKVVRKKAGAGHLMSRKSGNRCRNCSSRIPITRA